MADQLTLSTIQDALTGTGAAFRRRLRLQPAGGAGDKVFPPTYMGAVYATEQRRIDGEVKECVLLDSVQSQANRMEEALQQAFDEGSLDIPLVVVDFSGTELLDEVGRVTSLEAPHRVADAILRDSLFEGVKFRESSVGAALDDASVRNATPVFDLSPVSLLLGMWDSHGKKGGLGAKFERAITSEIVGVGAKYGVRAAGRIDPLGIQKAAGPTYRKDGGGWTLDESEAAEKKGKPPSEIGHGNVAPGFAEYSDSVRVRDPVSGADTVRQGGVAPGGVTMEYGLQTTVLSLPAIRRLRFPVEGQRDPETEAAARSALVALGLCAATLATARGYDLRSRCVLWPEEEPEWELLDRPGAEPKRFGIDGEAAVELLEKAVAAARDAGLPWRVEPVVLEPSDELVGLVRRSQEQAASEGIGEA